MSLATYHKAPVQLSVTETKSPARGRNQHDCGASRARVNLASDSVLKRGAIVVNKAIIVGNVGQTAELRYTPSGEAVTGFSLATSEQWKDKQSGEKKEKTEWHRIQVWGKQAETLTPYLVKGKNLYVEGRLTTRKWEKDGQTHYTTEIKADRIVLLGGVPRQSEDAAANRENVYNAPVENTGDEIPFAWVLPLMGSLLMLGQFVA